ncbi:phage tail tube protein [Roseovarius sp.]|uniref:phage tail tube protein n=1 Tax=Roseovarius sp. TaxID=1486281 RepID=UPI003D0BF030
MAKSAGRNYLVKKGGTTIASVRQKSLNWSSQMIDVTTDDDTGDTTYLDDVLTGKALECSVEGLTNDDVFSDIAFSTTDSDKFLDDLTIERPNGDEISGAFILSAYTETGAYQDAVTFTATLTRSGAHTFTEA